MIERLIVGTINYNCKTLSAKIVNANEIDVSFKLSVPAWCNDKDFIEKKEERSVIYARSSKKGIGRLEIKSSDVDGGYPHVTNNKFFVIRRRYNIVEWCKDGTDFLFLLKKDRDDAFREIRSNIVLEQIGDLTKKWTDITDGKWHDDSKCNYAASKYNSLIENINCSPVAVKKYELIEAVPSF